MSGQLTEYLSDVKESTTILLTRELEEEQWGEVDRSASDARRALQTKDVDALREAAAKLEGLASSLKVATPLVSKNLITKPAPPETRKDLEELNEIVDDIELRWKAIPRERKSES